ncbi:MAG: MBL fold metallo-hydrolase [Desulfobacteraceae bacterium]|jgi:glyoxylase-like metal-dependent hydrolase (beta-lactamase superfamily II)|nr:MAG: MBL fold metallo-hydrolase [Desulfobacteraceae bacterium]
MKSVIRIEIPIPFPIGSVNLYFIEDSVPTLIDAGFYSEEALGKVGLTLKKAGYQLTDVKRILLTHGHLDHVGLAGKISGISGAEVFVHPLDRDKCIWNPEAGHEKKIEGFFRFAREAGLPDALTEAISFQMTERFKKLFCGGFNVKYIRGGETFAFDNFFLEVICCPGHTAGSVCFFDPKEGRLFSGDHLLEKITPNPVIEIGNQDVMGEYKSLSSYMSSLEVIRDLDVALVLPGHGSSFSNHRRRINEIIGHHRMRRQEILDAFSDNKNDRSDRGGMTLFMVSQKLFPELRGWDIFLGLSETYGHLEVLEDEGLTTSRMAGDQRLYCLSLTGQR